MASQLDYLQVLKVEASVPAQWELRHGCRPHHQTGVLLPSFFPVLYDLVTSQLAEPVILYLHEKFVPSAQRTGRKNTLRSVAEDLRDWYRHLEDFETSWADADIDTLNGYVVSMTSTTSPKTGRNLEGTSIKRRLASVRAFYFWASTNLAISEKASGRMLLCPGVARDFKPTAKIPKSEFKPSPLTPDEARKIIPLTGKLPSECSESWVNYAEALSKGAESVQQPASSTFRIACHLALEVGLRVEEVANLPVRLFAKYSTGQTIVETKNYKISIRGKGHKSRVVEISGALLKEITIYIWQQRKILCNSAGTTTEKLLVHSAEAGARWAGKPVSTRTVQRAFSASCKEAGYVEVSNVLVDPGELSERTEERISVLFRFHDLRHTYAIWTYFARSRGGDLNPWLYIQKQLGHENLSTTLNIYLSLTTHMEEAVSDAYMEHLKK